MEIGYVQNQEKIWLMEFLLLFILRIVTVLPFQEHDNQAVQT
jgi:hypothetical protein